MLLKFFTIQYSLIAIITVKDSTVCSISMYCITSFSDIITLSSLILLPHTTVMGSDPLLVGKLVVNNINDVIFYLIVSCVCNLVDHVILYCLQSSVGRAVTDIATETSRVVAQVVQPAVAIVSIRDAPILVLYRTTSIKPIPALLMVSAISVVCVHIIDHKALKFSN